MQLRFGIALSAVSVRGTTNLAKEAEQLGYELIGVWDSPSLFREVWTVLSLVAHETESVLVGPWVTNPVTRHPGVTASAISALDEIAPGRVILGIGSGDSGVYNLGEAPSTLRRLEYYILTVRRLLEYGRADFYGNTVLSRKSVHYVPIYLAGHGRRAIHLAGRVADGVIMGLGCSPDVISYCLDVLHQGAMSAGKVVDDIDVWWGGVRYDIDPVPGAVRQRCTWEALASAYHLGRGNVKGKFVPPKYEAAIQELAQMYQSATHGSPTQEQQDLYSRRMEALGVRDYLFDRFLLAGTPDEVWEKVRQARKAGAAQFVGSTGPEDPERMRAWAKAVIGRVGN